MGGELVNIMFTQCGVTFLMTRRHFQERKNNQTALIILSKYLSAT